MVIAEADRADKAELMLEQKAPMIEFAERAVDAAGCVTISDAAKVFGVGPRKLFLALREHKFLMSGNRKVKNRPYQKYVNAGYFQVIENLYTAEDGNEYITAQTLVTAKVMAYLQKQIDHYGLLTPLDQPLPLLAARAAG